MKQFKMSILLVAALVVCAFSACSDANEYADADTNNPSWVPSYNDSTVVPHPESLAGTTWVRGTGLKYNAYGEEVQGFVESLVFETDSSYVTVRMSEGVTKSDNTVFVWKNKPTTGEEFTEDLYEYSYSSVTGRIEILGLVKADNGQVSKQTLFSGTAVTGTQNVITIAHFGDTPIQTYLVRK